MMPYEPANPDIVGYPHEQELTEEEILALEDEELDRNVDWERFVKDCEGKDWFSYQDKDTEFIAQYDIPDVEDLL